jgi:hypothetical protein
VNGLAFSINSTEAIFYALDKKREKLQLSGNGKEE